MPLPLMPPSHRFYCQNDLITIIFTLNGVRYAPVNPKAMCNRTTILERGLVGPAWDLPVINLLPREVTVAAEEHIYHRLYWLSRKALC